MRGRDSAVAISAYQADDTGPTIASVAAKVSNSTWLGAAAVVVAFVATTALRCNSLIPAHVDAYHLLNASPISTSVIITPNLG